MNIYRPYKVLEDSDYKLHLTRTTVQRVFLFILYRGLPIICLLLFSFVLIRTIGKVFLSWGYLYFVAAFVVIILGFIQKVIYEAEITRDNIKVTYGTYHGRVVVSYSVDEIQHFSQILGKNGTFIYMVLKNGKKKRLLIFSVHKSINKFRTIFNRLTEITGLEVENRY